MLYATTRSKFETGTVQRALSTDRAPDGGFYVPMRMPIRDETQINKLFQLDQHSIIAEVLNDLFATKFTGRDIQFYLGKNLIETVQLSHRVTVAEYWHNREGDFSRFVRLLTDHIGVQRENQVVSNWMEIAARIAFLFVSYSQICKDGLLQVGEKFDVTVLSGDFTQPMAAWYARQMGLPVGNIVCCCNENGAVWDFVKRGELKTATPLRKTGLSQCDIAVPEGLERLISASLGYAETECYLNCLASGGIYTVPEGLFEVFRDGLYASVIGTQRIGQVMANTYSAGGYLFDPYSALCYAGLMDYRASGGENRRALMIVEASPLQFEGHISAATGLTGRQIRDHLGVV